jgi:Transposase
VAAVMIGIDPHKASHTAFAIDGSEQTLGKVRVQANRDRLERLVEWAASWPERTWAVENATGLGHLITQQLLAVGEEALDVPPKLAAKGPAALRRRHQQERPQRRPVGGGGRAALDQGPPRGGRGLLGRDGHVVGPSPGASGSAHPGGVPAARPAVRARARRLCGRVAGQQGPTAAAGDRAGQPSRSRPPGPGLAAARRSAPHSTTSGARPSST